MYQASKVRASWIRCAHYLTISSVLFTATFVGWQVYCRAELADATDERGPFDSNETKSVSFSEAGFDIFFRHRAKLRQIPGLASETVRSRLTYDLKEQPPPFLSVRSPTRREFLSKRILKIDLSTEDWATVLPALSYFPEITEVYVTYDSDLRYRGNIEYEPAPFEQSPVPISLLKGLLELPHLDMLAIRGGLWTTEAAEMLAEHPSLRRLGLGRCRFSLEAFSKLSALKTLEDVSVIVGLDPRSFITLAKLPRLRSFAIGSTDEFNVPIDDATTRAIESLDGRLETFTADTIPTTIHADIFRALLKIKSLKSLSIDTPDWQLTPADFEPLKSLTNLVHVNLPSGGGGRSRHDQERIDAIINSVKLSANQRKKDQEKHNELKTTLRGQ